MFKIKKIRVRITLYFSVVIILVILALNVVMSLMFSRELIKQTRINVNQKLEIINRDIDKKVSEVKSLYMQIIKNKELQVLVRKGKLSNEEMEKKRIEEISNVLKEYAYSNIFVNSIFIFDVNKEVLDPYYTIPPYSDIIKNNQEFEQFVKNGDFNGFSKPSTFPMNTSSFNRNEKRTITYYSQFLNDYDYTKLGYTLINIRREYMFDMLETYYEKYFDSIYIVDEKNNIIFDFDNLNFEQGVVEKYILKKRDSDTVERFNGDTFFISSKALKTYPNWRVIGIVSYNRLTNNLTLLLKINNIIGIVCILSVVIISFFISKNITVPIFRINKAIKKFKTENKWPEKIDCKTEDEMKYLVSGFNSLFDNLKNLINEIYEEQEKKKEAEVEVVKLQLKLLQSQINPHFVHNTLNAIEYLALEKEADNICEMIQSLNLLFRTSMSIEKIYHTIEEELACILSYMKIMRYRYGDIFTLIYEIDDDVKLCKMPKLILQPLIENALYHGIVPKNSHGTIIVKMQRDGNKVKIRVIDDGVGIHQDRIKNIFIEKKKKENGVGNIGLYNIYERLRGYSEGQEPLNIFSKRGIGTTIIMSIPFMA